MNRSLVISCKILLLVVVALGCKPRRLNDGAELRNDTSRNRASFYLRKPDDILAHARQAWKLDISKEEEDLYINNVRRFLGGVVTVRRGSDFYKPGPFYVVAIDNLSWWLADKIMERQKSCDMGGQTAQPCGTNPACPFKGANDCGNNGPEKEGCYEDAAVKWCDFDDGLSLKGIEESPEMAAYYKARYTSGSSFSSSFPDPTDKLRKKIYHNIQDLGEYLLTPLDDLNEVPDGGSIHSVEFLYDMVFFPALKESGSEKEAWRRVIYTILVSGGFYMRVDDGLGGRIANEQ